MTPGEEALREAARLESARVYSRTSRETTSAAAEVDWRGDRPATAHDGSGDRGRRHLRAVSS